MGSGLSLEVVDRQLSDESPTKTASQPPENHHNTKSAVSTTSTRSNKLPHELVTILKDADTVIDKSSIDKLYTGVYLNNKKRKYWVDEASNGNCFLMFARDLWIRRGDYSWSWSWPCILDTSEGALVVAQLLNEPWLEVNGKFEISMLTPGIKYEVAFVVKMTKYAFGWQVPINITLKLPDGTKQEHKENMMEKPRSEWFEIPVGEFMVEARTRGSFEFSMFSRSSLWKAGLVVKGAAIRPKLRLNEHASFQVGDMYE